jgi:glyoxylase-like metal-dependent hydrolase (beta-lactamase superfamily II)
LPAGNDQLASLTWHQVPGAPEAAIYPLIRKIDVISSNSYLITTPDAIILIDPGGLPEQAEHLSRVIGTCRAEKDRPLFIFLTHAHIDHFLSVQSDPAFAHFDAIFAIQESGASALESGDTTVTQAELLQAPFFPMKIGLHLFAREGGDPATGDFCFPKGARITITRDQDAPDGLPRERIEFGPGPALIVYHTPGHSPDSICLQIGKLLFIGDLLFAACPGIAGIVGWSQETLIHSLGGVEALIVGDGIQLICPGHGRMIHSDDALRMLSAVRTDACVLTNIAELNHERAARTAEYARDCMEQVNELFTIMSGRLQYVSYILDELGESGMADQASLLIRGDTIDELLETFHTFAEDHRQGHNPPLHLMLKAGQVIAKLERTFQRDELTTIIGPTLVQRASRLLSDYTTMLRGFSPPSEVSDYNLIPIIEAHVTMLSVPVFSDEEVLLSSDDDAAFSRILLARIGARPLLEDVNITVLAEDTIPDALIDRDHFVDLLTYILEDLVGTGAGDVEICTRYQDSNVVVTVTGAMPSAGPSNHRTWRFLQGLSERAGGTLKINEDGGITQFVFSAMAAGEAVLFRKDTAF